MNQQSYDVAIIGASIGGCTAATLLAQRGLRVALIERQAAPAAYKRSATTTSWPAQPRQSSDSGLPA